jgi:hypothetical protein
MSSLLGKPGARCAGPASAHRDGAGPLNRRVRTAEDYRRRSSRGGLEQPNTGFERGWQAGQQVPGAEEVGVQSTAMTPRFRRRIPCSLNVAGRQHSAMVTNVSRSGLFVRTTALARRDDHVGVDFPLEGLQNSVELLGNVVWRRIAHAAVSVVSESGIGLQLSRSPAEYLDFLGQLESRVAHGVPANSEAADVTHPAPGLGATFEVRLKQCGAPRSRWLRVDAGDEAEASAAALQRLEGGWEVFEVRRPRRS